MTATPLASHHNLSQQPANTHTRKLTNPNPPAKAPVSNALEPVRPRRNSSDDKGRRIDPGTGMETGLRAESMQRRLYRGLEAAAVRRCCLCSTPQQPERTQRKAPTNEHNTAVEGGSSLECQDFQHGFNAPRHSHGSGELTRVNSTSPASTLPKELARLLVVSSSRRPQRRTVQHRTRRDDVQQCCHHIARATCIQLRRWRPWSPSRSDVRLFSATMPLGRTSDAQHTVRSFGGVQHQFFPEIVPEVNDANNTLSVQHFDTTNFRVRQQCNPLVIGLNDTTNPDKRIFGSDGNVTMRAFAESRELVPHPPRISRARHLLQCFVADSLLRTRPASRCHIA
ncbi:hypothetical protein C8R43DRAFT_960494 [Mycena crocata]|nr:hypothetical protein C8R43DRAFT_960494 [Mycena crocata]